MLTTTLKGVPPSHFIDTSRNFHFIGTKAHGGNNLLEVRCFRVPQLGCKPRPLGTRAPAFNLCSGIQLFDLEGSNFMLDLGGPADV